MPTSDSAAGSKAPPARKRKEPMWLVYVALLLCGVLLLAEAIGYAPLQRTTARLGIAFVFSAVSLFVGNGRISGYVAAGLIWVVAILVYFI